MTALLAVEDLSLGFATEAGFASVLDRVSLSIERGRVVGLVGESGCGKTTLARAILGVLPRDQARITGGRVWFRGTDLLTADPAVVNHTVRGRAITFVPQDPFTSFNPLFTVGEQIMEILKWKSPRAVLPAGRSWLPAVVSPYPADRRRADFDAVMELLDAVQLPRPDQLLRKYPHELSGGQRQRLMIAMALLPGPDLVIADEPTTALDVTIQAQILGLIRRLATERNVAVLLTTHASARPMKSATPSTSCMPGRTSSRRRSIASLPPRPIPIRKSCWPACRAPTAPPAGFPARCRC